MLELLFIFYNIIYFYNYFFLKIELFYFNSKSKNNKNYFIINLK